MHISHVHLFITYTLGLIQSGEALYQGSRIPSRSSGKNATILAAGGPEPRKVTVITDIWTSKKATSSKTGDTVFGGHAILEIDGSSTEGPLSMELGPLVLPIGQELGLLVRDFGVANSDKPFPQPPPWQYRQRHSIPNGVTLLTNAELFDHQSGRGLVADAWRLDPEYVVGTGFKPNDCFDFIERVLAEMRLPIDAATRALFENSQEYYAEHSRPQIQQVHDVAHTEIRPIEDEPAFEMWECRIFDVVEDPDHPEPIYQINTKMPRRLGGVGGVVPANCRNASSLDDHCRDATSLS